MLWIIIRSASPDVFCAGADLKERAKLSIGETKKFLRRLREVFLRVHSLKIPTTTSISGAALGGGLELALMTDMRIADARSTFALPEVKLGIIPGAGGTQFLPHVIGYSRAAELIYTGKVIDATEAERIGLINKKVDNDSAFLHAMENAKSIAASGPIAVQAAKKALKCSAQTLRSQMRKEFKSYEPLLTTYDRQEGLDAFQEKRKPRFLGK